MNRKNKYYTIAVWGAIVTVVLQVVLFFTVDPYIAGVLSPFYSVWVIVFVVGWRQEHPRQ